MHKLRAEILSSGVPRPSPVAAKKPAAALGASLANIPVKRTESRTTNQREGDRLPGVIAETTLTIRRRKQPARVINISSDGAMLEVDADVHIGDKVAIELGDGSDGPCIVRWLRDGRIGLEFDGYSLELGYSQDGQFAFRRNSAKPRKITERAKRESLVWRATLHAGPDSIPVRMINVSATGAQLEGTVDLAPDMPVLLDFASVGMMPSTVRWCEKGRVGLSFDRHFDVSLLAICTAADAKEQKVEWIKPVYLRNERDPNSPHRDWAKFTPEDLL